MPTDGYNGWTNYETWNVALWLDNDEGTYNYVREMAQEERDRDESCNVYNLAERIKEYVGEFAPELEASMFSDLLNAALSEVDWREIAANVLDES